jgi:Tfp pilus assembly protein PilV
LGVKRDARAGFSVIEALVAVAVMAIALVPLLTLQSQVTRQYTRERAIRAEIEDQRNALAVLRDVNAMRVTTGEMAIGGGHTMAWRTEPLTREASTIPHGDKSFDVALYRIDVDVRNGRGARLNRFSVDQLGWRDHATAN